MLHHLNLSFRANIAFIMGMLLTTCSYSLHKITDYHRIFLPVYTKQGEYRIAIRVFKQDDAPRFLVVNPDNFVTAVLPVQAVTSRNPTKTGQASYSTYKQLAATPYYQLLNRYADALLLENQGLTHAPGILSKQILTIDLCPSLAPFEQAFFQALVDLANQMGQPTPITIAISGLWLIDHPTEFHWLLTMVQTNKLNITWVNHSFTHAYFSDLPYSQNFLRQPLTNIHTEIMLTEQYLLEQDVIPSVFFRFPGLVSSPSLLHIIRDFGLIPLGADAWLAKDQSIQPGSIILVHGNGNEHEGIVKLLPQLSRLHLISLDTAFSTNKKTVNEDSLNSR